MQYRSDVLEIAFDFPAGWQIVEDEEILKDYLQLTDEQIDATAFLAINLTKDEPKIITFTHDMDVYPTETDYVKGLEGNIQVLVTAGATILSNETLSSKTGVRIDRLVLTLGTVTMAQYYIHLNELLICASTEIKRPDDETDRILMEVVHSAQLQPEGA